MSDLISAREAATEARVTTQYINQLISDKVLEAQKIGSYWAISRASFDAWQQKRADSKRGKAEAEAPARAEA